MQQYRFSDAAIKKLIKQIIILVDSREKKNGHITDYFAKNGIAYQSATLHYGDVCSGCIHGKPESMGNALQLQCAVHRQAVQRLLHSFDIPVLREGNAEMSSQRECMA